MRYNREQESKIRPARAKNRKPGCRAAALGMAGAVLVLHAGTVSACVRTGGDSWQEGQQESPVPHLMTSAGIPLTAEEGEKKASDGPEQESVLNRWNIDSDDLPPEEDEQIPTVPEEIREYFEEAVASTVEKYEGSTPPASDLSRYSLRADTIRAEVRAKARRLMKKESGRILDRMNSFALSFGGPAIAKMSADMQSRTAGKMTAFGKGQRDVDRDRTTDGIDDVSSSPRDFEGSPSSAESSAGKSSVRVPFLSIIPSSQEQSSEPDSGLNEDSRENEDYEFSGTTSPAEEQADTSGETSALPGGQHDPDNGLPPTPPGMYSFLSYLPGANIRPDQTAVSSGEDLSEETSSGESSGEDSPDSRSYEEDSAGNHSDEDNSSGNHSDENDPAAGFSDIFSDNFSESGETGFPDYEVFPDLTANFALARPLTSGRLYYKYGNKGHRSSVSGSGEMDDTGDVQDNLPTDISDGDSVSRRNVVFIGDSRTVGMEMFVGGREDEYWFAQNSMGYSWLVNTAAPSVDNLIGENTDVVILMGVNDLGNVNLYVDYMNEKAAEWKERGARTFFVSVTPVVDSKSPNAKNSRIESFNAYAIENLRNVHYIDAYNRIRYSFGSPDGIHFDAATYREIYRIIHFYLYQGWYEEAGLRFYFDCGQPLTGWHCLDGTWQYMDGAGVRWVKNSRVGDVCLAPYPMTGLTDPDAGVLSSMYSGTFGLE